MKSQFLFITIFVFSYIFFSQYSFAQIGGISASKVGALCAEPIGKNHMEFEPFFAYSSSQHYFDSEGNIQALFSSADSTMKFSGSGFRFTYGAIQNMEIGVSLPIDISEVRFGIKYKIPIKGKLGLALIGGYNNIVGNQIYVRRNANHEATPSFLGGFVASFAFNEKWSVDFDAQYQKHTEATKDGHSRGFYSSLDFGYYLFDRINFVVGLSYNIQSFELRHYNSYILSLNTGVVIEKAEHFILVVMAPFDLMGKNEYRTKGFGLALTILLD